MSGPERRPHAVLGDGSDSIAALDDAYLATQDAVAAALAAGDHTRATAAAEAGAALRAVDAERRIWRVMGPLPTDDPKPHHRYRYRHQMRDGGEQFHSADAFRFARHPSLAASGAERLPKGALRWVVRVAEPAAYVATIAVGIGLWLLLGDLIGSLPGVAVLATMVIVAAGLWGASTAMDGVPYREAARLAQLTRLAAIGVTGAVAWAATIDVEAISDAGRVLLTASVILVAGAISFRFRPTADVWTVALGAFVVAVVAGSVVIAELLHDDPDTAASAQLGALAVAIVGTPLTTWTARIRWVPFAIPFVGAAAAWALLGVLADSPNDLHTVLALVGGTAAAAITLVSGALLPSALRSVHRVVAAGLGALTMLILLARAPWEWLEDVPLPVVLIVSGSLVLVAIGLVIRTAVRRMEDHR